MSYLGQELGQGKANRETYTATGGETSVNVNYSLGQLSVYLNGVKLMESVDFVATNGTSITGLTSLAANDVMDFVSLDSFSPADTVSAASGGTFLGVVTLPSPVFTGVPATPTASAATNTTQVASTAFVRSEVAALADSAPSTLDTLNELAAALNDDAAFSTTVTNSIALKAPIASPTFTGNVVVPNINGTEIAIFPAAGINNTGIGVNALDSITTGDNNTAVGVNALTATDTGVQNMAFGYNTLVANVDGNYNVAIGDQALVTNITGDSNMAIGNGALGLCTGHQNTAVGSLSMYNTTGNYNVAIGKSCALNLTSGSSNITIGTDVNVVSATASNQLNIGNTIYGDLSTGKIGIGATVPDHLLHIKAASGTSAFLRFETDGSHGVKPYMQFDSGLGGTNYASKGEIRGGYDSGTGGSGGWLGFSTKNTSESLTMRMTIDSSGHVLPGTNGSYDLGSSSLRWRNVYTSDLHLANERGNWTVIEEEDYLTLRNNKTDKVYKLVMEEI